MISRVYRNIVLIVLSNLLATMQYAIEDRNIAKILPKPRNMLTKRLSTGV